MNIKQIFDLTLRHLNTDLILKFDDGHEIETHTVVCAKYSGYFFNLFNYCERSANGKFVVEIHGVSSRVFDILIDNFYGKSEEYTCLSLSDKIDFYGLFSQYDVVTDNRYVFTKLFNNMVYKRDLDGIDNVLSKCSFMTNEEISKIYFELFRNTEDFNVDKEIRILLKYKIAPTYEYIMNKLKNGKKRQLKDIVKFINYVSRTIACDLMIYISVNITNNDDINILKFQNYLILHLIKYISSTNVSLTYTIIDFVKPYTLLNNIKIVTHTKCNNSFIEYASHCGIHIEKSGLPINLIKTSNVINIVPMKLNMS